MDTDFFFAFNWLDVVACMTGYMSGNRSCLERKLTADLAGPYGRYVEATPSYTNTRQHVTDG